jgi:cellulose synthase/poly-beta-1,6-N-acetylglucosamine synthase-like glycosyltransferase
MKPLVSILIPAYKAEEWVAEAIESAVAQTWERKEIIVVNNGSGNPPLIMTLTPQYAWKNVVQN